MSDEGQDRGEVVVGHMLASMEHLWTAVRQLGGHLVMQPAGLAAAVANGTDRLAAAQALMNPPPPPVDDPAPEPDPPEPAVQWTPPAPAADLGPTEVADQSSPPSDQPQS